MNEAKRLVERSRGCASMPVRWWGPATAEDLVRHSGALLVQVHLSRAGPICGMAFTVSNFT